jgi:hypothetical protein
MIGDKGEYSVMLVRITRIADVLTADRPQQKLHFARCAFTH